MRLTVSRSTAANVGQVANVRPIANRPPRCLALLVFFIDLTCLLQAERRPRYGGDLRIETRETFDQASAPATAETLVRIDEHGNPQPLLATSWTHDAARKRWIFSVRPPADSLEIPDDKPIERILREMARPQNAIANTGPFRVAQFDPGKSLRLEANDSHWQGRPFLDAIQIQMGRALRDQELD